MDYALSMAWSGPEIRGVFRSLVLYVSTVCESLELTELCDRMCVDFD
jgi:hypothetical protein